MSFYSLGVDQAIKIHETVTGNASVIFEEEANITSYWSSDGNGLSFLLRGGSRIFFRRGCTRLLLYFNTNKPHSFFFLQNTSCIRKPQVISGGGGGCAQLHPPPRSAPVTSCYFASHVKPPLIIYSPMNNSRERFAKN